MIKEGLALQKRKKNFGTGKNRGINIITNIIEYPHEFSKLYLMIEVKIITPFDGVLDIYRKKFFLFFKN